MNIPDQKSTTEPITVIFTWKVTPGREAEFEEWAHGITSAATKYPGHLGASWLKPVAPLNEYHTVLKFDTLEHFTAWETSEERAKWLKQVEEFSTENKVQMSGLETWFTIAGKPMVTPPPRWKMWLLTLCAVYPLSLAFQFLVAPFLSDLPLALRTVLLSLTLVTLLTYLVMPNLTKLLKRWLYPNNK